MKISIKLIYKSALVLGLILIAVSCAEDTSAKKEQYESLEGMISRMKRL